MYLQRYVVVYYRRPLAVGRLINRGWRFCNFDCLPLWAGWHVDATSSNNVIKIRRGYVRRYEWRLTGAAVLKVNSSRRNHGFEKMQVGATRVNAVAPVSNVFFNSSCNRLTYLPATELEMIGDLYQTYRSISIYLGFKSLENSSPSKS